jgi:adenylosuccinate synthase
VTGRRAFTVVDLLLGDAGKGATVDALCRRFHVPWVVRFHGGAQAGHRVVAPDGRAHVFSSFAAGLLAPGTGSLLGPDVVVHPAAMLVEANALAPLLGGSPWARHRVHRACRITTPMHQALGRLRELARGDARHGSCGLGFGETIRWDLEGHTLTAADVKAGGAGLRTWLRDHQACLHEAWRALALAADPQASPSLDAETWWLTAPRAVDESLAWLRGWSDQVTLVDDDACRRFLVEAGQVVFEGAQGMLLDEDHGLHPHTTWSRCGPAGADALLQRWGLGVDETVRLGVARIHATRHGAGPLPSEHPPLMDLLPEPANGEGPWQGAFRVGWPDAVMLRTGARIAGPLDGLVLTHLDRASALPHWQLVEAHVDAWTGETLDRWPLPDPADWAAREAWTLRLGAVTCRTREVEGRAESLAEALVNAVGIPLAMAAAGPRAGQRTFWGVLAQG